MRSALISKLSIALPTLKDNLVFADIAALLIQNDVISDAEYQSIVSTNSESLQITMLVDFLFGKEDAVFEKFVDVLKDFNAGLADDVVNGVVRGDVTDSAAVVPRHGKLMAYKAPDYRDASNW